jgi:hypothetical protein
MLQVLKCESSDPTVSSAGSWLGLFIGEMFNVLLNLLGETGV